MDSNVDNTELEFGSLFSGVGGMDLGLEQAGMKCVFQVENEKHALTILNRHWPDVPKNEIRSCMGLVGGDPCPIRSIAASCHGTTKPDLSGYFLAMVARIKPRWVLRENVPHPDAVEFHAVLVLLGYRASIVRMDSAVFTGQSRRREFVVAFDNEEWHSKFSMVLKYQSNKGPCPASGKTTKAINCLDTRQKRRNSADQTYVYEIKQGLRHFTHNERESLQGLPVGWTDGIPNSARERGVGNAVTVPVAKWLGERIKEALIINQFMP